MIFISEFWNFRPVIQHYEIFLNLNRLNGQRTWIKLPLAAHRVQGKHKQWRSLVPQVLHSPISFQRALLVPQVSLCSFSFSRLLCRSCSIGSQLSLRKNCSKHRGTFNILLGGGKLNVLLCHHFYSFLY